MSLALRIALLSCLVAVAFATPAKPYLSLRLPHSLDTLIEGRIVGGEVAFRGEFPHLVSLQYGSAPFLRHLCGGSILNNEWVLTAGHCPMAVPGEVLHVKAGKHSLRSVEKTEQVSKVSKVFIHEKYPGNVGPYDIALLKLEKPFVYDEFVQLIGLPASESLVDGEVVLSGWGSVIPSGTGAPDLQKAELVIVDLKTCKEAIEDLTGYAPVAASNVCTGPLTGGISACKGDSGGPLIKVLEDGTTEVIGVASWGIVPCGTQGAPSVYTRVSAYIDWIEEVIANN